MAYARGAAFVSHLLYADDVILFAKASLQNMKTFTEMFELYGAISGQVVNWAKSNAFFGKAVTPRRATNMIRGTDIIRETFSFLYLGVPLFCGAPRKRFLQLMADKIVSKFSSWKGSSLSMARVLL